MGQFKEVMRPALPGEKILIVNAQCTFGDYENGQTMVVEDRRASGGGVNVEYYGVEQGVTVIWDEEYVVLEPIV